MAMPPNPVLAQFSADLPFALDDFQQRACHAVASGESVLLCAPTGAGKTVVGEFAAFRAVAAGQRCFYTTPIKALSNQKYTDLAREHGAERVGLLTGEATVNPDAAIVVMTTEVLRNMIYADTAALTDVQSVVLDEIHYLADQFRGAVWEEILILAPQQVQVIGLSATVSNAEEFGAWLAQVRGSTTVIVDEHRPVPLWQHMLVGSVVHDLFEATGTELNRVLRQAIASAQASSGYRSFRRPRRHDVLERLGADGLLPAIYFIFSRVGCQAAVEQCLRRGAVFTTEDQRRAIAALIDRRCADLDEADLEVLGYWPWRRALECGFAAHHAGLLPVFKETVEEAFAAGLVACVFATETLALGINMPARTVVLERLVRYNGLAHVSLTAGEYTQLSGRAGRRGIDLEGHAVVLWQPGLDAAEVAGLASTRSYPLNSSFQPTYNMTVNLVRRLGVGRAHDLVAQSFAQYQTDAHLAGLIRQREQLIGATQLDQVCECGDLGQYLEISYALSEVEKRAARHRARQSRTQVAADMAQLRRGDVIAIPRGKRKGLAVVIDGNPRRTGPPLAITDRRWVGVLSESDFTGTIDVLGHLNLSGRVDHRNAKVRRDVAAAIAALRIRPPRSPGRPDGALTDEIAALRATLRAHPVHRCPDRNEHLSSARQRDLAIRQQCSLTERIDSTGTSLGHATDRIVAMLTEYGYLAAGRVTAAGELLAGIWAESDLLIAECLRAGLLDQLAPPELAGVVAALVYSGRADRQTTAPTGHLAAAVKQVRALAVHLATAERRIGLDLVREPDPGMSEAICRWCAGADLAQVLPLIAEPGGVGSAGDFVRWCRQTIDLLDQLIAAGQHCSPTARAARVALFRGVVAMGTAHPGPTGTTNPVR